MALIITLGMSRILGITTHLNIPTDIPLDIVAAGIGLTCSGLLIRRLPHMSTLKKGVK